MKKKLLFIITIVFMFVLCVNVKAKTYTPVEIPNDSYVIGTHLFTRTPDEGKPYEGTLTTQWIMQASKTDNTSVENKIIYYKALRGNSWSNAINDEDVEAPESFDIQFVDGAYDVVSPTIVRKEDTSYYTAQLLFNDTNYCYEQELCEANPNQVQIIGWNLYRKVGDEYSLIANTERDNLINTTSPNPFFALQNYVIDLTPGETYTFVINVYGVKDGQAFISDYSNEVIVDATIPTPLAFESDGDNEIICNTTDLCKGLVHIDYVAADTNNEYYHVSEDSVYDIYDPKGYTYEESPAYVATYTAKVDGFEVYEKDGDTIGTTPVATATSRDGHVYIGGVTPGSAKAYVARAYKTVTENNEQVKKYSDYTDPLEMNFSVVYPDPVIARNPSDYYTVQLVFNDTSYCYEDANCELVPTQKQISGWELYRKVGNEYTLVANTDTDNLINTTSPNPFFALQNYVFTVDPGETYTYVIRVFGTFGTQTITSGYSNEIVVDATLPAPIEFDSDGNNEIVCNSTSCSALVHINYLATDTNNEYYHVNDDSVYDIYDPKGYTYEGSPAYVATYTAKADGYDVFEKNGNTIGTTPVATATERDNHAAIQGVTPGSTKKYVARAYKNVVVGGNTTKVYSDPTDPITIVFESTTPSPLALVSATPITVVSEDPNVGWRDGDNIGIKNNDGKYTVSKSGNVITVTDNGLTSYTGGNNVEGKWVGILVDLGTKAQGVEYNIEAVDYLQAARWGATNNTTFVLWTTTNYTGGSRTITFTNEDNVNDTITVTINFVQEQD